MAARRVRSAARLAGPFIVTEDEALVLLDIEVSLVEAGFEVISGMALRRSRLLTPNQHASRRL
jgi:hypothetical protein